MKWIIKNPAPPDSNWKQKNWGDFHFGRCLTKYLKRLDQTVETDYYPNWDNNKKSDIVLVLRGLFPYQPKKDAFNIMWNISHPDRIDLSEYEAYDMIFVASNSYTQYLQEKISTPVYPLLQCTDPEEFYVNQKLDSKRKDIIFVGNTRGIKRPSLFWAVELQLPIKIWGRGWDKWIDKNYIQGSYYENQSLRTLYSGSKVTLNDHLSDMNKNGFINNRIFDSLACGLPIISDYNKDLYDLFPEEILYYRNKKEFTQCINTILYSYSQIKEKVDKVVPIIQKEHSFESRVNFMLETINSNKK